MSCLLSSFCPFWRSAGPTSLRATHPADHLPLLQCTEAVSAALGKLRAAGVELIPFDSSMFDSLAVIAWPGPPGDGLDGASTFESTTTLARCSCRPAHTDCSGKRWLADHEQPLRVTRKRCIASVPTLHPLCEPSSLRLRSTLSRWLLLRNSTLSVPEVYDDVNRPSLKAGGLEALQAYSDTPAGQPYQLWSFCQPGAV